MRNRGGDRMLDLAPTSLQRGVADIGGAQISLAQCQLDDDRDIALTEAWRLLSADEVLRARRFRFEADQSRYVRGRGFLRIMLGQACGQPPARVVFGTGAQGKPFLQGSDLAFNLSHSRDLAVLVISRFTPLGIDLEFIDRAADIVGLTQTCLTSAEADVLVALPEEARRARFFAFWTAKEARMKLTGEGMSLPPRRIALDLHAGHPIGYLHPDTPAAQAVFPDLGHPGAVCCLALAQGAVPVIARLRMEAACDVTF